MRELCGAHSPVSSYRHPFLGPRGIDPGFAYNPGQARQQALDAQVEGKLKAANPTFADIVPTEGQTVEVWGVVIAAIKQFKR